ncbi:MAG: cyclic nucleotide-binding domain-containing protein [Acidimicrobiales bacterium]
MIARRDPIAQRLTHLGIDRRPAGVLSTRGTVLDLGPGRVLCREGERGTQAFLLVEGTAEVATATSVIAIGPGDVVGELATLDPGRSRNATVTTTSPTRVIVFDAGTYRFLAAREDLRARLAPVRTAA